MNTKPKTRLSKAEQRVAVAKDALKQLQYEKYTATKGVYIGHELETRVCKWVDGYDDAELSNAKEQLQPLLIKDKGLCKVCAKGALFLSAVRKFNKATVGDMSDENFKVAENIFGSTNFDLIEAAFEKWDYLRGNSTWNIPSLDAEAFGHKYDNDHDRLVAILKNIIKNNGTFKP